VLPKTVVMRFLNLVNEFQFTENQGAAIVDLRLYRLTSTDLVKLEEEKAELHAAIEHMQKVINDPNVFNQELINIFTDIKAEYASKRKNWNCWWDWKHWCWNQKNNHWKKIIKFEFQVMDI
jgi:DNA gyrase/topoisomerase IV subunit A